MFMADKVISRNPRERLLSPSLDERLKRLNKGRDSATEDGMTSSGSRLRSRKDKITPIRARSVTRVVTALKSSQHEEDGNMNNKGKAPMLEIVELESNSCEENETLSPGYEMDEDVDAQMMEPLETSIQEGIEQASSNKKKCKKQVSTKCLQLIALNC